MKLKTLYLRNYRNYEEATFEFTSGINAIVGPNAIGKTNLLEAIHFLGTGRSFRTHHLGDLVRFGASSFYLEAHFVKNGVEQHLKIDCDGRGRKIHLNKTPLPTLSALLGILVSVILAPEDQALVKGYPHVRRHYLDLQIAQSNPLYLHHLSRYLKAMKHRNALLRAGQQRAIEVWEEQMATAAHYITEQREATAANLEALGEPIQHLLSSSKDRLSLRYKSAARSSTQETKDFYLSQYQRFRKREFEQRTTLFGPHKDDLLIEIGGKEARHFASEGQTRSSVAALRFAEWAHLKVVLQERPMMSVDDVGISLDPTREERLYAHLSGLGQVFLTSPREPRGAHIISLHSV